MSAYTPYPWTVDGTTAAKNLDVIGEGGRVAMLDCDDIDADTLGANARLIAAAPDLLNALDGLLDYLRDYDADYPEAAPIFGKARAAIAKATGENT